MKYILLGTFVDTQQNANIINLINSNDPAANNYQGWLIDGFKQHGEVVKNISFKTILKGDYDKLITTCTIEDAGIKFRTKNIYKNHLQRFKHYYSILHQHLDKDDIILVYSLSLPALIAAILRARKHRNKLCVIIPDLPLYMSSDMSLAYRTLKHIDNFLIKLCLKFCSHYVLLTKHMISYLPNILKDNNLIIEGAYNNNITELNNSIHKQETPYVLYSGTLDPRYGIRSLVDAFMSTSLKYNLVICGNGKSDEKKYLVEMSHIDSRIKYIGAIDYRDVLYLQKNASLLVNPRNNRGEFTKYSFPSKTMEYLASGTPTLLYKLDGIPNEYYEYCYAIDGNDDTVHTLSKKIVEILSKPNKENKELGIKAKDFIINNKTGYKQVSKIIEYLN